jgi:hypothetical protein
MRVRGRLPITAILVCVLLLVAGLSAGAADAKKKKKAAGPLSVTKPVNLAVPDRALFPSPYGRLDSTIVVGKKFKNRTIRDVNVTFQTAGNDVDSAQDFAAQVTAPNGATAWLVLQLSGQNIGPLTLDDESQFLLGGSTPSGFPILAAPYQGAARPGIEGLGSLSPLDFGPVKGNWTLQAFDTDGTPAGITSTLISWTLNVKTGGPLP